MEPLAKIQREDIVTFRVAGPESELLIKRVVGLPGDTIWADQGRVTALICEKICDRLPIIFKLTEH